MFQNFVYFLHNLYPWLFSIFKAIKSGFRPCEYWIYLGIYTKMVSSFLFFVSTVPGLCCASGCLSSSGGQWLTYKRHRNKPFTKDNVPLRHVTTADNCSCCTMELLWGTNLHPAYRLTSKWPIEEVEQSHTVIKHHHLQRLNLDKRIRLLG